MADTKKTYDDVLTEQAKVDEQELLDKFNAATVAQYNLQREQNRQAENKYYNQMYNTQKTAMDTIRQNNAAAVATGASRGVQAANELSAILGLQQESVAGATELAQAQRQTAQEETAAVLENVLKAYQQIETERQNAAQNVIQGASVDATQNEARANLALAYEQARASGDTAMMQSLAPLLNIDLAANPNETQPSGVDEHGNLRFASSDVQNSNATNIYNALAQKGIDYDKQALIDINNPDDYDKIKQNDFNSKEQSGEAANYINAIKADAAAENIPVGARVVLNYGKIDNSNYECIYLGYGKFAWVKPRMRTDTPSFPVKDLAIYTPAGYVQRNIYHNGMYKTIMVKETNAN